MISTRVLLVTTTLLFLVASVFATPYVPSELLKRQATERMQRQPAGPLGISSLDELDEFQDYVLTVEYNGVLEWLTTMQELEPGDDFGGQHEGETATWDIIQTDNTQEALRDWSHYARVTGDLDRFQDNVDAAWTYTLNYPAYLEEGGGDPNYYRVHNCGWALVAAMEYTEAYGTNDTYLAYADSCARYLDNWRLSWDNVGVSVEPLSAGFGAGALYLYAQWRGGHPEWITAAQEIATDVQVWIEYNPNRLNNAETWAMSGGTAMWGVVTALYLDDPDAGADWIPQYTPYMDIYSGPGNWNNSWTVWYGFAWHRVHQVLGDTESLQNAKAVAAYLLDQVHLDDDYGLPGTEGTWEDDQSWTSAYLIWYELEQFFNMQPPVEDPAVFEILQPHPQWPLLVGNTYSIIASLANDGLLPFPSLNAQYSVLVDGDVIDSNAITLNWGELHQVDADWTPFSEGETEITVSITSANDENPGNSTLTEVYQVYEPRLVGGVVVDSLTGDALPAAVEWTLLNVEPELRDTTHSSAINGVWSAELAPGDYMFAVTPGESPYPPRTTQLTVEDSDILDVDFEIPPAKVMLVSDKVSAWQDSLLIEAFAEAGHQTYYWNNRLDDSPGDRIHADALELVVWSVFSGDTAMFFDNQQFVEVLSWLENHDGPGGMIFSGDGLMNRLPENQKTLLRIEPELNDLVAPLIVGGDPSPLVPGDTLFSGGIVPQTNFNEVESVHPDMVQLGYYALTDASAGQCYVGDENAPYVVTGFRLDGLNDYNGRFISRTEFLHRTMTWMGMQTGVHETEQVMIPVPDEWTMHAWPNPFNPSLNISVTGPSGEATVALYNVLGQEVASWVVKGPGLKKLNWSGQARSSGIYFLQLTTSGRQQVQRVTLLR